MIALRTVVLALSLFFGQTTLAEETAAPLALVMVEQTGCQWCARWNAEIAPIYPKTDEGKAAPLRRIDLHEPVPDDLTLKRPAVFTPTFVLVQDGEEVSRMEGYPGEEFFWSMLEEMMASVDSAPSSQ